MKDLVQWLEKQNNRVCIIGQDGYQLDAKSIQNWMTSNTDADGLFLLVENALGISHFAGAFPKEETNYFVPILGLESKHSFYTKSQVEEVLASAKVKGKFYYPYPDVWMTEYLFTDERGPKSDDALCENPRYDEREFSLFSESDVMHKLSGEDCFGTFANYFLVELNPKEDVSYIKFSDNRKKEFAIQTVFGR